MSNTKKFNPIILTCLFVIVFAFASDAFAQSELNTGTQINAANELVREGKITEAIDAYSAIGPTAGQEDQLNYNLGIAHYRNGDADAAATLFSKVAGSGHASLASDSQYNLGNCHYSKALQLAESDKPAAISKLKDAVSFYRGALRSNPNNADARANIELAGELMKQLKDEQKQDEQKQDQQNQDEQKQDQQKQDQQNQDEQKQDEQKQDQQNQDQQNQDQQSQDQQNEDQQKQDQQNQDQSEDSESKNQSDESNSSDPKDQQQQSEADESKSKNDPANDSEQNKSSENQDPNDEQSDQANTRNLPKQNPKPDQQSEKQNQPAEQAEPGDDEKQQPVPSGELKAAKEQDKTEATGTAAGEIQKEKAGLMTREEALKMLQSVRDRDMLRRLKQQQRERSRRVPVDRDW